jgi:hypothetical protein
MSLTNSTKWLPVLALAASAALMATTLRADPGVRDKAVLFKGVDENLEPVDMATLIRDKPLVLVVGSAS